MTEKKNFACGQRCRRNTLAHITRPSETDTRQMDQNDFSDDNSLIPLRLVPFSMKGGGKGKGRSDKK